MASQYGQDELVLEILRHKRGGFFLDSGAADGVTASNTLRLETDYGWNGICVEPNRRFYAQLTRSRKCICVHCCLYDAEGPVRFIEASFLSGIEGTHDKACLADIEQHFGGPVAPLISNARTPLSVLRQGNAPPVIDYWSLDTEGSELAILQCFPFERYAVRVITVEHNRYPVRADIFEFLQSLDYVRYAERFIDDCYVRRADLPVPAWRSRARR